MHNGAISRLLDLRYDYFVVQILDIRPKFI